MRNIIATLMVSQGTPMISHGDEVGRTQLGNNNVYCQDSPLSWMDWALCQTNADLLNFARRATGLRKAHPVFRRRRFFEGEPIRTGVQVRDITWLTPAGTEMTREDWGSGEVKRVTVFLNGDAIPAPDARGERVVDDSFLLCFNAHSQDVEVVAPDSGYAQEWTGALDSAMPTGDTDVVVKAGETFLLRGRSLLILRKTV
jgi:glycogen operon protein